MAFPANTQAGVVVQLPCGQSLSSPQADVQPQPTAAVVAALLPCFLSEPCFLRSKVSEDLFATLREARIIIKAALEGLLDPWWVALAC